jgi:hypothetical protein
VIPDNPLKDLKLVPRLEDGSHGPSGGAVAYCGGWSAGVPGMTPQFVSLDAVTDTAVAV